jgi:RNA polymerase sigma factor for flagellar operon FliA
MKPEGKGAPPLDEARRRLAEDHLGLVERLAQRIARDLPPEADLAEMVSAGREGLLDAARRYDPARGASFETYAYYRIRGAIFDGLRKMAYLSRQEYARHRQRLLYQERADQYLADRAEEPAGDAASEAAALEDIAADVAAIFVTSLEAALEEGAAVPPAEGESPEEAAAAREMNDRVRRARASLEPKEARLLELHYEGGLSLAEAARRMGISKPWASRLHARAIRSMAQLLGAAAGT